MAPGTTFVRPGKHIFSFFMISGVFRRGLKKLEEITSCKSYPKSHYFAPIGLSSVLGYLWTSFGFPFMLNSSPSEIIYFATCPKRKLEFYLSASPVFVPTAHPNFLFFQRPSLVEFIFILCWFVTKLLYFDSRFGPSGRPNSVILHPLSPKVVLFCPPVRWVMVKDVFFSQPVRWVTVSSTHRE